MFESFAAEFGSMLAGNVTASLAGDKALVGITTSHVMMGNGDKMARYSSYHLNNRYVYTI
ncbi:hypothetical protein [Peribacillus frigoritolerans]|uniref:hypothetical protein n=1 Tax=Peribacillus frigoritolerans TaxID=450367 RepID=UPI00227E6897|nr:hypothetical protein [Peribacillus frigoritolerans]MCY8936922.1 hypothetical protein [Peribacillus frigoritolerans]